MSTASRLARRPWWRLASLLALAGALLVPGAADAARPVASGMLAGDTTITWRGNAGIVLRVPRTVSLPKKAMKLYVQGGTYAFVRMYGHKSEYPACVPLCTMRALSYIRAMADLPIYEDSLVGKPSAPGDDHFTTYNTDPPTLDRMNQLEVYLFTDGVATLKLRPTGLGGRVSYAAGGRVKATARKLPATCVTPAGGLCDPKGDGYAGAVTYGGMRQDIGPGGGVADVIAFQRNKREPDPNDDTNQLNGIRVCLQPGPFQGFSSADPAYYPFGCNPTYNDSPDGSPAGTVQSVFDEMGSSPGVNVAAWDFSHFQNAFDSQYIGWRAVHGGLPGGVRAAYGVWIPAGIGPA